jgi:hypothetical protein
MVIGEIDTREKVGISMLSLYLPTLINRDPISGDDL